MHLRAHARVFHDREQLRHAVSLLTTVHEATRDQPWKVSDAPEAFINSRINGIVGLEVVVEQVEAKAKLSQNRPLPDRIGVIAGLQAESGLRGEAQVAAAMLHSLPPAD